MGADALILWKMFYGGWWVMAKNIRKCKQCGKEFATYQKSQEFCSRVCASENRAIDLTGRKFGRLECIWATVNKTGKRSWLCNCECGNTAVVLVPNLLQGKTVSCGCYHSEMMRFKMERVGRKNRKQKQQHTDNGG